MAPRSPTPTAGGSTPSEPAPVPSIQSGHLLLDNFRDIVVEASATWLRHGSVAPWGAAGCRPAVFRHRGFDSLPAHHARHASQVGHRALTPDKTGFETQGAHHAAVAQPARAAACRAEGHGFKSRRWRHVDVAEWRRHRSTKPESAGSTPAVDAQLAVAQWTRAPPSEGGGRTFESCRRGACQRSGPCSSASQSASPVRTSRGCDSHRGLPRGREPARSGACPEKGRGREAHVGASPPLPPHAAVVQRTRRRALNPEAGVRLPVAVLTRCQIV